MVVCNSVASGDVEQIVPKSQETNLAGVADGLLVGGEERKQAGNPEEGHVGQSRG